MATRPDPAGALAEALRDIIADAVAQALAAAPSAIDTAALLSIPEAAVRLGISATTLKRYVATGQIQSASVGRRRLIPTHAIEAFADSRRAS